MVARLPARSTFPRSGMLVAMPVNTPASPELPAGTAIVRSRTGSALSASGTSAAHRWQRSCCATNWRGPGWPGGDGGQCGHRRLARGGADARPGPERAGPPRLRRLRAPGAADPAVLAGRLRPAGRDGPEQPRQPAPDGPGPGTPPGSSCCAPSTPRWPQTIPYDGEVPDPYGAPQEYYAPRLRPGAGRGRGASPGSWRNCSTRPRSPRRDRRGRRRAAGAAHRRGRARTAGHRVTVPLELLPGRCSPTAGRCSPRSPPPSLGGVFGAEARGLRWLGEAGAVGVPGGARLGRRHAGRLAGAGRGSDAAAAERFGRELARLHGSARPAVRCTLARVHRQPPAGQRRAGRHAGTWPDWYRGLPGAALPAPGRRTRAR